MNRRALTRRVHKWGPYSPLPQPDGPYNHVVYPLARGIIRTKDGRTREMRPAELEKYEAAYSGHLAESFKTASSVTPDTPLK